MVEVTRPTMADDSGLFIDGTELDKAFFDEILDEVDTQCHSGTNPTRTPANTTDEVVSARGSKASLDARLDVSLEEDGTLKTQASLVTASQVQSTLGGRNVAVNGDLDDWSSGGALAPDSFTLAGAAATIARTGVAMADTFHFGTGSGFAAKITRAGTNWTLTQDVIPAASFANYVNVKGQKISASVKGKTALASYLRIVVDDGVTTTASSYHTGGGTEEHLSVTHTISNSATKVSVYVEGTGSNGDAYVGGFNIVFADLAPSDWQPLSATPDANATRRGVLNPTGTQVIAGTKSATGQWTFTSPPVGSCYVGRCTATLTKNNNSTLADVTGLAFPIGANETWVFEFRLYTITSSTANLKVTLTGPSAPTAVRFGLVRNASGGGVASQTAFASNLVIAGVGAAPSTDQGEIVHGIVRNGANAGTVQLQAAQNTNEVADTKVYIESYVIAHRVA